MVANDLLVTDDQSRDKSGFLVLCRPQDSFPTFFTRE